mmetsp:Transcript_34674/g.87132  ORF Transcript_34674/g.87132 Transcript_34674/m.87132 type:complete len:228 (-) Transcript_34674:23-706(-)
MQLPTHFPPRLHDPMLNHKNVLTSVLRQRRRSLHHLIEPLMRHAIIPPQGAETQQLHRQVGCEVMFGLPKPTVQRHRQEFIVVRLDEAIELCSVAQRELLPQRELEQLHVRHPRLPLRRLLGLVREERPKERHTVQSELRRLRRAHGNCGIRTWQTARDAFGHVGREWWNAHIPRPIAVVPDGRLHSFERGELARNEEVQQPSGLVARDAVSEEVHDILRRDRCING